MIDVLRIRFLRARKFDVAKAKEMLISCEQWRKDFNVDDIVKCAPHPAFSTSLSIADECTNRNFDFKEKEQVDKYYPQYYHKTDKVK